MVTIIKNNGLSDTDTSTRTSSVCEPTAAANTSQAMMTGNWFASFSTTGGAQWVYVDPFTRFPPSAGGFCCDQIVQYNPRHRIWIWLLQYITDASGENIFRLAICRETAFGSWYYWDFVPSGVSSSFSGSWFDYPDLASTDDNLFVTFNMFRGNAWQRAVVFRFPLVTLASGGSLGYRWWSTTSNGSLRLCRGAGATMYFGSHNSFRQLRVFEWPDSGTGITSRDVDVRAWAGGAYSAPGPGGADWLVRLDPRITAAWVAGGVIGFMWTANRDATHPLPFIRVSRIREGTGTVVDEPDIWSRQSAWCYPAAAPNASGQLGFTAFYGGGTRHPGHVVGVREGNSWRAVLTRTSTHGPRDSAWGDYLSCVPHYDQTHRWVASGYTLQGGTDRRHIEPRYVEFQASDPTGAGTVVA